MSKLKVEWVGPEVQLPAEDRILKAGDQLEMEEAEARDREAAGQVRLVKEKVARATKGEE